MSKKKLTKLLAFTMCAGMILQPVAANAQEVELEADREEIILEEDAEDLELQENVFENVTEDVEVEEADFLVHTIYGSLFLKSNIADILVSDHERVYPIFTAPNGSVIEISPLQWTKLNESTGRYEEFTNKAFDDGKYQLYLTASIPDSYSNDYAMDVDFGLIVDGVWWTPCGDKPDDNEYCKSFDFVSPVFEINSSPDPVVTDDTIYTDSVSSNISDMLYTGGTAGVPTFESTKPQLQYEFQRWEYYHEKPGWSIYPFRTFNPGTFRAVVKVSLTPESKQNYTLDPNFSLNVNGEVWRGSSSIGLENGKVVNIVLTSPAYDLPFLMALQNVYVQDGVLYWDPIEGADDYALTIDGKQEIASTNSFNLDSFLEKNNAEPGTIEITIVARDSKGRNVSLGYEMEYEYTVEEPVDPEEIQGTWTTKWGATYFVKENGEKATGVQKINGGYYLFSKRGTLQKNTFYEEDGKKYYFGADGIRVTGWRTKWTCTYYFDENGVMQTGFVDIDGGTYYFNAKGHQVKNDWVTEDGNKYYVKGDGTLARSQTITKWGKKYSFDADGVLIP